MLDGSIMRLMALFIEVVSVPDVASVVAGCEQCGCYYYCFCWFVVVIIAAVVDVVVVVMMTIA